MNFKDFLNENKIYGWKKEIGTLYMSCDMSKLKECLISLLSSEFGSARGSGTGSADSVATATANKHMTFSYGFSEAIMGSFLKLNGKDFNEKDFFKIFEKYGVLIGPDYEYEMGSYLSFGNYAMMHMNDSDNEILIIKKSSLKSELMAVYHDMEIPKDEATKYLNELLKSLK